MEDRKIIHIDMDAFFASVEQRDNPELAGKPVAVGGGGRRGVVASASYEARKYGVRSAMPGFKAVKLCPQIIFVRSRFDTYKEASQQIREIFFDYTDLVEPLSLDEAYLDVTENKKHLEDPVQIAEEIRQRIFETTQLTASAGISFNKFIAKVASDINKPNGFKVITREEAIPFLEELDVRKFHGIGKVTAEKMNRLGIYKGADLKRYEEIELIRLFGKSGRHYYRIVRADDRRAVNPERIRKSIGAERTFSENVNTMEGMKGKLGQISDKVFNYMERTNNYGRTITLKMKSPDFKIHTRSKTYPSEIKSYDKLLAAVYQLLEQHYQEVPSVRLLGISVSNLEKEVSGVGVQLEFDFE